MVTIYSYQSFNRLRRTRLSVPPSSIYFVYFVYFIFFHFYSNFWSFYYYFNTLNEPPLPQVELNSLAEEINWLLVTPYYKIQFIYVKLNQIHVPCLFSGLHMLWNEICTVCTVMQRNLCAKIQRTRKTLCCASQEISPLKFQS